MTTSLHSDDMLADTDTTPSSQSTGPISWPGGETSCFRDRERLGRRMASSRLFGQFPAELRTRLTHDTFVKKLEKGDHAFRVGQNADHFTWILSGIVKVLSESNGTVAMLGIFGPGETIGTFAVINRGVYPADAVVACKNVEIARVPATLVLSAMQDNSHVANAITQALLDHTKILHQKIHIMNSGSVGQRLAALFGCLAERFGDEDDCGAVHIPLALSRAELASLVGARVETVIRMVRRWEVAGLLKTVPTGFHISRLTDLEDVEDAPSSDPSPRSVREK